MEQLKNIKSDTIARTIVLALALINQCLAVFGKETISLAESDIYQFVSIAFTLITAVYGFWKNNSFTKNAIKADEYLNALKSNN